MLLGLPAPAQSPLTLNDLVAQLRLLIYTSAALVRCGDITVVGRREVREAERLSERIVADRVWLLDDAVRSVTPKDRQALPTMRCAGSGMLVTILDEILHPATEPSPMARVVLRESSAFLKLRLRQ
jgi:hypothetical protein